MSFEENLNKFEQQLQSFRIAAKGGELSFSKFSVDPGEHEQRIAQIEKQFNEFTIRGDTVHVAGSIKDGFIIHANP